MPAVVFDFDSTLIRNESLEAILAPRLAADSAMDDRFRAITRQGMDGTWSFRESLETRLSLAAPTQADIDVFLGSLNREWTPGMVELVEELHGRHVEVWIVSGAFRRVLRAAAGHLGVPVERVHGVLALDAPSGWLTTDPTDPFLESKVAGVRSAGVSWSRPAVGVGDGMTDYAVYSAGLVDHFIAFTANVRREAIVATGAPEARTVAELRELLEDLLLRWAQS